MGNLGLDIIDLSNSAVGAALKTIEELAKIIAVMLESHENKRMFSVISEYVQNGGGVAIYTPKDFAIKDIEKKMQEKDLPYAFGRSRETGAPVIIIRDCDRDIMHEIQTELYMEQKRVTRLTPEEFYSLNKNRPIYGIDNLTAHQVNVFQEAAKKSNFVFTAIKGDDEKYKIYVNENDIDKANFALITVSMESSGLVGEINQEEYTTVKTTIEQANKLSHETDRDFYVVSASNPDLYSEYIHVNSEGFEHLRCDKTLESKKEKESYNFEAEVNARFNEIIDPVILTAQEFALPEVERNKLIRAKFHRPHLTEEQTVVYGIEKATIEALNKGFRESKESTIDIEAVLSSFDNDNDKDIATNFIKSVVAEKQKFNIEFVEDTKKELQHNIDIDKDFDVDVKPDFSTRDNAREQI